MPRTLNFQTNFVAGVLDPRLASRTDLQQYYQGVEEGTNVLNLPQGGMKRRPGMAYQATLAGSSRILMFAFNVEQTYLMAFSNWIWEHYGYVATSIAYREFACYMFAPYESKVWSPEEEREHPFPSRIYKLSQEDGNVAVMKW